MEWMAAERNGWTDGSGPVVNEMLLHDVYDLPHEVLRAAPRKEESFALSCPLCGGTGDRFAAIRHENGCPRADTFN